LLLILIGILGCALVQAVEPPCYVESDPVVNVTYVG